MSRHTLAAVVSLILALVAILSQSPAGAQGDPSAPPPQPNPAAAIRPPFSDTFDTPAGWIAGGAWQFDTMTAYSGGGWYLDSAPRQAISILECESAIDLGGAERAQLLFRQRGWLPPSDLVAVDLSLDGGLSWFMIDQQIGLAADWELRTIDLADYRGQVIRLRFRVNAGADLAPTEFATGGYWLDNLTIQYVSPPPDPTPEPVLLPVDATRRTLMGLHLVVGAQKEPVLALAERLKASGWPLGTLKGTSGTEEILNAVKAASPETVIVYRSLDTPWGMIDCPYTHGDPVATAQAWIAGLQPFWQGVQADYFEITNECLPPLEWLIPFTIEAMRVAGEAGQCLLLFSFTAGRPEPAVFTQLIPVYDYALQHPCRPGQYHGIALHTYGLNETRLVSESGIFLGFRHRLFYTYLFPYLPGAIQIPVYLTEAGAGDGSAPFTCADVARDVVQYTQQLEFDPYIKGFHLWNVGPGTQWIDLTACLTTIGDALIAHYSLRDQLAAGSQ